MSERKLVTVRQVTELRRIPDADRIEMAKVDGWEVVVKKGEFKVGDYGVYFEIDSFLPFQDDRFAFLRKTSITWNDKIGMRIRTMKLRKQISQGLLLPLESFPEIKVPKNCLSVELNKAKKIIESILDKDFSELLGVSKWEREVEIVVPTNNSWLHNIVIRFLPRKYRKALFNFINKFYQGKQRGKIRASSFPSFIRKTDEERVQNLIGKGFPPGVYGHTIKLDGSSATYYIKDNEFGICSRNQKKGIDDGSNFSKIALRYDFPKYLPMLNRNLAIQGELMGPGIQGNRENLEDHDLYVYKIFDIDTQKYMGDNEKLSIITQLKELGCELKQVPNLGLISLDKFKSVEDYLKYAEGPSLNSKLREGIVFNSIDGSFSFKAIANSYLLKYNE